MHQTLPTPYLIFVTFVTPLFVPATQHDRISLLQGSNNKNFGNLEKVKITELHWQQT